MNVKTIDISETSVTMLRLSHLFSIYSFDITNKKSIELYYYFSIITEILIHLRDICYKLQSIGNPIDIKEFIPEKSNFKTVAELIIHFRDAACHNDSKNRRNYKGFLFAGNVFAAYDYPDEITLLMGDEKLFVKRHLVRVYRLALQKFASYMEFYSDPDFVGALSIAQSQGAF